ncbi:3-keto-5-aminohexanoate cleavage enzyme [subsurface metagenome]
MRKAIITAAITGSIHTPSMSPYLPITPKQIADESVRAYEAGAAVVHIHARNPETGQPDSNIELFREIITNVKSRCNVVINITTGGGLGMSIEERVKPVPTFKPELASLNFGSINFCLLPELAAKKTETWKYPWEEKYIRMTEDLIFANTFKSLREFCQTFAQNGTKPEIEIYDIGMIYNLAYMLGQGAPLKKPVYLQFVLGVLGSIQPSVSNLLFLYNTAREAIGDFVWSVCVAGRAEMPLCTTALTMGGNARVGMEDSLWLGKGVMAKSNAELVEKIVRIAQELSIDTATPDEARQILGLKGLDKVNY